MLLLVVLISLLPLFPLLQPGMFLAHDSQSHIARLIAFYQSLSEGNIIPRWAGDLNNGFGHPVLMFLYPLSSYIGSLWHFLGFSYVDSVKLTFALSYILSGVFMYLLGKRLADKKIGLLMAVLYLFAPYRFVDLYVRAALGENLAFAIMPLVLLCFYDLVQQKKLINIVFSGISLTLLLLSHNAISLMFLPFLLIFLIILRANLIKVAISFILGFGLSAFFWLPAFFEGKYTLRDIVTINEYSKNFPDFFSLLYSPWNFGGSLDFSHQIGIIHWSVIILAVVYLTVNRKQKHTPVFWLTASSLLFFFVSLFLMNKTSLPIWQTLTVLQKFQFPWRFLTLSVLAAAFCGLALSKFLNKIVIVLCFLAIIFTVGYWKTNGNLEKNDQYFISQYQGTTDTGESSPRWSIRGMEEKSSRNLRLIDGEAVIKKTLRKSNVHEYLVEVTKKSRFAEDTVYFPGWEILANNQPQTIEFQDPNYRGLITFYLDPGNWRISVKFRETRLRSFANLLSVTSLLIIFVILVFSVLNGKRKLEKV